MDGVQSYTSASYACPVPMPGNAGAMPTAAYGRRSSPIPGLKVLPG